MKVSTVRQTLMVEKGAIYPDSAFIGLKSSIFVATFEVLIEIH
jgi:hypothetical protein